MAPKQGPEQGQCHHESEPGSADAEHDRVPGQAEAEDGHVEGQRLGLPVEPALGPDEPSGEAQKHARDEARGVQGPQGRVRGVLSGGGVGAEEGDLEGG